MRSAAIVFVILAGWIVGVSSASSAPARGPAAAGSVSRGGPYA
jgi:hypothetical protein